MGESRSTAAPVHVDHPKSRAFNKQAGKRVCTGEKGKGVQVSNRESHLTKPTGTLSGNKRRSP